MTCKRCGTPLILADGRRVDQVAAAPPDLPGATPAYAFNGPMYAIPSQPTGVNWVLAARLVCIAYGVVTVIGLLAIGFFVRHVDVPVQNPATGAIVYQTVDLGGILAVTAIVAANFFAFLAWLTGYTLGRVIMLLLMLLSALVTISRMSGEPLSIAIGSLTSLLFDCAFAFVLIMSLVSPPRT
jgi:hypothetical protein